MPRTQPVTRSLRAAALAVSTAALLAGCVSFSGIDPKAKIGNAADLAAAQALASARVTPGQWPSADWWTRFGDTQLDALVREALDGHPSIRAALARVDGAVAIATITGAAQGLGVTASFDNTRQLLSKYGLVPAGFGGRWITTNQLALNLKYEVDFWDRNQAALEAALGQAKAGEAEVQSARLSLASGVTLAYIELARNFEQLDIARATLAQREAVLGLARTRLTGGLDSQIDVRQVESTLPEVHTRITQLEQSIAMGRNQIAALLGKGPDRGRDIARPQLATSAVDTSLPSQLPADLIGRRPDIVASRWRIEASARDGEEADGPSSFSRFRDIDSQFHLAIAEAARSPRLAEAIVAARGAMFHPIGAVFVKLEPSANELHEAVVDAIDERDREQAAALMGAHIESTRATVVAWL